MGNLTDFERSKLPPKVPRAQLELGASYIYAIQSGEFVKFGLAVEPERRLTLMQIGNPVELVLLRVWPSLQPLADEECLHAEFERFRVRGEWFKLPADVLQSLLSLPDLSSFRS